MWIGESLFCLPPHIVIDFLEIGSRVLRNRVLEPSVYGEEVSLGNGSSDGVLGVLEVKFAGVELFTCSAVLGADAPPEIDLPFAHEAAFISRFVGLPTDLGSLSS